MWLRPIEGEPYKNPPPKFKAGELIFYDGEPDSESGFYKVLSSDHAYCQVEGRRFAVACWRCKRAVRVRSQVSAEKIFYVEIRMDRRLLGGTIAKSGILRSKRINSSHPTGASYRHFLKFPRSLSFRLRSNFKISGF